MISNGISRYYEANFGLTASVLHRVSFLSVLFLTLFPTMILILIISTITSTTILTHIIYTLPILLLVIGTKKQESVWVYTSSSSSSSR